MGPILKSKPSIGTKLAHKAKDSYLNFNLFLATIKHLWITRGILLNNTYDTIVRPTFVFGAGLPETYFMGTTLRKLAHAINTDFLALKIENFELKCFDIFLIIAQNIDCGYTLEPPRRGGSNEYPQSMFWSKNKKNRYTPAYPSFAI